MNSTNFGLFWNHVHPPIPSGALGAGPLGQQGAGGDHRLPPRGEPGPPRSARAEEAQVHRRGTPPPGGEGQARLPERAAGDRLARHPRYADALAPAADRQEVRRLPGEARTSNCRAGNRHLGREDGEGEPVVGLYADPGRPVEHWTRGRAQHHSPHFGGSRDRGLLPAVVCRGRPF